jgi:hypothetical protein
LKLLAAFGLSVFVHYEAEEVQKTLHPRDPEDAPRSASHDLTLDHVEPVFPTIPPPAQVIEAAGIASSEAFGTPTISVGPSA